MDDFRKYLSRRGKKAHVVEGLVRKVIQFDCYLRAQFGRDLQSARPEDIEAFSHWLEEGKPGSARKIVRAIALYYAMTGNEALKSTAGGIREAAVVESRRAFSLREFRGIDERCIKLLESASRTPALRMELSKQTGILMENILEIV